MSSARSEYGEATHLHRMPETFYKDVLCGGSEAYIQLLQLIEEAYRSPGKGTVGRIPAVELGPACGEDAATAIDVAI